MILIALSWIVLLFFFISSGIAAKSVLNLKSSGNYIPIFLGVFIQCIVLNICSFFFRIGLEVFIANFLICIGLTYWKSKEIKENIKEIVFDFQELSTVSKLSLFFLFLFSLLKCSQYPFIIDNESYYLQTIKWINEYGFVKGLGNLHIYLGQTSPFHVLQAGFNFNFISERSNDLNGLILNLSSLYFITEFEKRNKINGEIHWIGFILVFNILFFQFINAPSPDLSIVLFSQILFYHFLDKENNFENFKIVTLLFLFLIFVKITVVPLGLIVIYLLGFQKNRIRFSLFFGSIIAVVLILKNLIITGYPFYPLSIFPINKDWTIPEKLLAFFVQISENAGYFKTAVSNNQTMLDKLISWIQLGGMNRIFNLGILLLFAAAWFVKVIKTEKKYFFLYIVLALHLLILLFTSPQYRFFLPEFVFLFVLLSSSIFSYLKINQKMVHYFFLVVIVAPLFFTEIMTYPNLLKNQLHQEKEKNNWSQILMPKENSKFSNIEFEKIKEGNLNYFSPKDELFFYGTADGHLPCVNKLQLNYLKTYYHFKPQQRTSNLGDGFYSKRIKNE